MNRAIPAVVITVIGLGALASFRSTTGVPTRSTSAVVVPRSTSPAAAAPPTSGTSPTTTAPRSPASSGSTPTTASQNRTFTGDPIDNPYGTVQVQVSLSGGRITNIVALQMPNSHQRSIEISQGAEPILRQEALQAQSAQIDVVSGATFTSDAYSQSLQAALDRAHG